MKIAICDDTAACRKEAEENIQRLCGAETEIRTFSSGEELLAVFAAEPSPFDAVFLDVEMDGEDGIDTANEIRKTDKHVLILFITAYKRHALRSFECQPFRFLVKPVKEEIWQKTFRDIHKKLSDSPGTFVFTEERNIVRLYCEDILFFESRSHWVWVYTKESAHKICVSLTNLVKKIDTHIFCRVHKSYVINLSHIQYIKGNEIFLYHFTEPIPISRSCKKNFLTAFSNFQERKYVI